MPEEALDTGTDVEEEAGHETEDESVAPNVHEVTAQDELDDEDLDEEEEETDYKAKFSDLEGKFNTQTEELSTLKSTVEKITKENNRMAYQLRQGKKETKEADDKPEFTDAQLQQLYEQHKDDPTAAVQIMKLIAQQVSKKTKDDTINDVEVSTKAKEMDAFLTKTYPDISNDGSEFRGQVDQAKDYLGVQNHPYGDYFAVASIVLNNIEGIVKHAREEGKTQALQGKAEATRKSTIKSNSLSPTGSKKSTSSANSSRIEQNIKQMGLSKTAAKIYRESMAKVKQPAATEA